MSKSDCCNAQVYQLEGDIKWYCEICQKVCGIRGDEINCELTKKSDCCNVEVPDFNGKRKGLFFRCLRCGKACDIQ